MKRSLVIIGILLAVILLIVFGGILLIGKGSATQTTTNTNLSTTFPSSGQNSGTSGSSNTATQSIPLQNGVVVTTQDFIHNGTTVEDSQNSGTYYLAGSIGYCNSDGTCPSGAPSNNYHIVYFAQDKTFIISIIQEPLGQSRKEAEQFLQKSLGITQQQMCSLKYSVLTTASVNSNYAGQNLGFSFCPGAIALP